MSDWFTKYCYIRSVIKDIYWILVGIVLLFLLFMVVRDVYHKAYPGMFDSRKNIGIIEEL